MRAIGLLLLWTCLHAHAQPVEETKQLNAEIGRLQAIGDSSIGARRAEYIRIAEEINRRSAAMKYSNELDREIDRYTEISKAFYLSKAWREYYDYRLSMYRKVTAKDVTETEGGRILAPQLQTLIKSEGLPLLHWQHEAAILTAREQSSSRVQRPPERDGSQGEAEARQRLAQLHEQAIARETEARQAERREQIKRDLDAQAARVEREQAAERARKEVAAKEQADRDALLAEYRRLQEQIAAQAAAQERAERQQRSMRMLEIGAGLLIGAQPQFRPPLTCYTRPGPGGTVTECQ